MSKEKIYNEMGGCEEAKEAFDLMDNDCCSACHDEPNYDSIIVGEDKYIVCCSVANALEVKRGANEEVVGIPRKIVQRDIITAEGAIYTMRMLE